MNKKNSLLSINNLKVSIAKKIIINGLNLTIHHGEVHAIMGPNGSGKSTLANVLAGNPLYTVTSGKVLFDGMDLLKMLPETRARAGFFLSFQ